MSIQYRNVRFKGMNGFQLVQSIHDRPVVKWAKGKECACKGKCKDKPCGDKCQCKDEAK